MRSRILKYFRYVDMSAASHFAGGLVGTGQLSPERQCPLATGRWSRHNLRNGQQPPRGYVPYKDPEKRRECVRRWRAANREKAREAAQRWRVANRDKSR